MVDDHNSPEAIARKVHDLKQKHIEPDIQRKKSQHGVALRIAIELASAVVVGGLIGYWLDNTFGTSPIFLILCLLFGSGAGFVTIKRVNDAFVKDMVDEIIKENEKTDKVVK